MCSSEGQGRKNPCGFDPDECRTRPVDMTVKKEKTRTPRAPTSCVIRKHLAADCFKSQEKEDDLPSSSSSSSCFLPPANCNLAFLSRRSQSSAVTPPPSSSEKEPQLEADASPPSPQPFRLVSARERSIL
ncbi:hypothetical protein NL676_027147 [Syzygium grande]|nr:hypothetical protein NL676_027147 [Syzygium grande]